MRLLLLPLLALAACGDASEPAAPAATNATSEVTTAPEASGGGDLDTVSPSDESESTPDQDPAAAGLATAAELLAAIQAAASGGNAQAFEPFLALSGADREMFDDYMAPSLIRGGDSHDLLMAATPADLTTDDQTTYSLMLNSETESEGETFESALVLGMAPRNGEYRIVSALIAG